MDPLASADPPDDRAQVQQPVPHQRRHGLAYRLWKTATPEAIRQILQHGRVATTLRYGTPIENDLAGSVLVAGI